MILPHEMVTLSVFGLGPTELIVILCIVFLLFGATKIPQIARGLGRGINEFKRGLKDGEKDSETKEIKDEKEDPSKH